MSDFEQLKKGLIVAGGAGNVGGPGGTNRSVFEQHASKAKSGAATANKPAASTSAEGARANYDNSAVPSTSLKDRACGASKMLGASYKMVGRALLTPLAFVTGFLFIGSDFGDACIDFMKNYDASKDQMREGFNQATGNQYNN